MTTATIPLANFRQAIELANLTPPEAIVADGQVHRFASNGERGDDAGWYVLHVDDRPWGAFGCFRAKVEQPWCAKSDKEMTGAERDRQRQRFEADRRQRDQDETLRHADAAKRAQIIWRQASPAPVDHPYLQRKQIGTHGLRVDSQNRLIVPVMIDGTLSSLQFIPPDGQAKKFLFGGAIKGGSYTIGDLTGANTILIGEGFATCAALFVATGYPVVVAFYAANLTAVAEQLRHHYPTTALVICGDNDIHEDGKPNTGFDQAQTAATAIEGKLVMPDLGGKKADWNDLAREKGFETVRDQIEAALMANPTHGSISSTTSPSDAPLVEIPTGTFSPVSAPQLLDEPEPVQLDWVWEDFLPRGGLGALVAKPKVGKTTNAYELAVKVAQGLPYLGRATCRGPVLILALEEHRREVKRRLRNLGADQIEDIHLHIGPLADSPDTIQQLKRYIRQHGIILVVLDTLNSFWSVQEENDAVAVTQAIKPLLALARESEAAVLLLHHARKSEGEFGDEIRGSGALFSLLDIALILKRHEVENQRKLTAVSRYPETPPELIIELRDHGHEALGDPSSVGKAAKVAKVQAVLTDTLEPVLEIARRAGVSRPAVYPILEGLVAKGLAQRTGIGKRNDPYRYGQLVSYSSLKGGGRDDTSCPPSPKDLDPAPNGGLVSFGAPILEPQKNNTSAVKQGLVSFGGHGGQTIRVGVEGQEDCHETEGLLIEEVVADES